MNMQRKKINLRGKQDECMICIHRGMRYIVRGDRTKYCTKEGKVVVVV